MNILVVGCGKVGSSLVNTMNRLGHDVSVIDKYAESFDLLDSDFTGLTVVGNPIDQDSLRQAGIEGCDAVAAVTPNDNVNVMVSQIAKEIFEVKKVLTRIYDPKREAVFAQFGLQTVCPTSLTVDSTISMLTDRSEVNNVTLSGAKLSLSTMVVENAKFGVSVNKVPVADDEVPIAVVRANGNTELIGFDGRFVVQKGDRLVLAKVVG